MNGAAKKAVRRQRLIQRDGPLCRFPGCRRDGEEIHHVVPEALGGSNRLDNLVLLCNFHHRAIHRLIQIPAPDQKRRMAQYSPAAGEMYV